MILLIDDAIREDKIFPEKAKQNLILQMRAEVFAKSNSSVTQSKKAEKKLLI
jgi:hypothetical protein